MTMHPDQGGSDVPVQAVEQILDYMRAGLRRAEAELAARKARDGYLPSLRADFEVLGNAFIALYLQAINGVVCDPLEEEGRRNCKTCREAWAAGRAVLDKHDLKNGNMYRGGDLFQPGFRDESDEERRP